MKRSNMFYGLTALNIVIAVAIHNLPNLVLALVFLGIAEYERRNGR
jgi:hypothetical protein